MQKVKRNCLEAGVKPSQAVRNAKVCSPAPSFAGEFLLTAKRNPPLTSSTCSSSSDTESPDSGSESDSESRSGAAGRALRLAGVAMLPLCACAAEPEGRAEGGAEPGRERRGAGEWGRRGHRIGEPCGAAGAPVRSHRLHRTAGYIDV